MNQEKQSQYDWFYCNQDQNRKERKYFSKMSPNVDLGYEGDNVRSHPRC